MDAMVHDIQKKYGSRALLLSIGAGLLFLVLGQKAVCRGVVLGGVFSTINFVLMGQMLQYRLSDNRKRSTVKSFLALALRYAVLAIPLILSVQSDRFDLAATVVGIFMVQVVIMVEHGARFFSTFVKH